MTEALNWAAMAVSLSVFMVKTPQLARRRSPWQLRYVWLLGYASFWGFYFRLPAVTAAARRLTGVSNTTWFLSRVFFAVALYALARSVYRIFRIPARWIDAGFIALVVTLLATFPAVTYLPEHNHIHPLPPSGFWGYVFQDSFSIFGVLIMLPVVHKFVDLFLGERILGTKLRWAALTIAVLAGINVLMLNFLLGHSAWFTPSTVEKIRQSYNAMKIVVLLWPVTFIDAPFRRLALTIAAFRLRRLRMRLEGCGAEFISLYHPSLWAYFMTPAQTIKQLQVDLADARRINSPASIPFLALMAQVKDDDVQGYLNLKGS